MTDDPNVPADPPAATDPPADPPAPVEPAAAPAVDMDALADRVVAKLTSAAQAHQPPQVANPATVSAYDDLVRQANDPTDPRHASAFVAVELLKSKAQDDEWNALGCPPGHPARALFAANPQGYAGYPRFAFNEWQNSELRRQAVEAEAASKKAAEDAARAARDSVPGMPSRSVGSSPRSGKAPITMSEYMRRRDSEPDLEDQYDRGELNLIQD